MSAITEQFRRPDGTRMHPTRPVIRVRAGELHLMADEGEDALLSAGAPFYVRGGLVRPVVDDMLADHGHRTKVARLAKVTRETVVDYLSRSADWVKFDGTMKKIVPADPPREVAPIILSREGEWRFPKLAGVITTPTLRPDGSLLTEPGYDPATQLLLLEPPKLPKIPNRPSLAEAAEALLIMDALLEEFLFVDDASRSVALSALITPVVRGAMTVAPLHATTAPVAGSGKSYLVDLASAISVGQRAPVIAASVKEGETDSRLVAAILGGQPIVSIDNVNGQLGGDLLCQMIERPVVSVRPLGVSRLVRVESRATCFATGNNIQIVGDMTRRVVLCSLDPKMERPETRQFRAYPFDTILADRGKYIAAALTIVRAYVEAGCPNTLPALASFEDWSRIVRSALVWLGRADPLATMEAARADDPSITQLREVLHAWDGALNNDKAGDAPAELTAGKVKDKAELHDGHGFVHPELRRALTDVAEDRRRGGIDTKALGKWLGRHKGRVVDGLKLRDGEDTHAKQKVWSVVRV